jgi:rRNA maturation endonuclease Nob1
MAKYSKDGDFTDPVVRCDACSKITLTRELKRIGCCPTCGNRKVRNLLVFNEQELAQMKDWGVDPDFIAVFEQDAA